MLVISGKQAIGPYSENDLNQLNTTLSNTTDSVLCLRNLRIQCKYNTTESSGSFFYDDGVCGFIMNLHVSSLYFAPKMYQEAALLNHQM